MPLSPQSDAWYEATYDADTLIRAEEIKADSTRLSNAREILDDRAEAARKAAAEAESASE